LKPNATFGILHPECILSLSKGSEVYRSRVLTEGDEGDAEFHNSH
jgi:hypothetical protein